MTTPRVHLTPAGPRPCDASERMCKYNTQDHFPTMALAAQEHQRRLTAAYGPFGTRVKRRVKEGPETASPGVQAGSGLTAQELFSFARESDLVRVKEDKPGLFILKYHKSVFFKNLWDDKLVDCRGIVFTEEGEIAQLPFTKIYNDRVEKNAPVIGDDEKVQVARKVNGFMGAFSFHNGEPLYSSTGSLTSPFVGLIEESMPPAMVEHAKANPHKTFLFEVVHPSDPHIIPEDAGVYLLGAREKSLGSPVELISPDDTPEGVKAVPFETKTMGEVRREAHTAPHEGFVVYASGGRSVKLKTPTYLTTKFLARGNIDKLTGPGARERVDEEYYPLLDAVKENREEFNAMSEQDRITWVRAFLEHQVRDGVI